MILVVGLGNPGPEYAHTRHNVGFMTVDSLNNRYNFSWSSKFNSQISQGLLNGTKLILAKPTTFMNLSGSAVYSIASYYKIPPSNIFVIHDDIDLEIGIIKFKFEGGNGGHNGLKSIDQNLGNNYYRIRIGIGRPENNFDVSNYVLDNFTKSEFLKIHSSIDIIGSNFELLACGKLKEFKDKIKT